LFYLPCLFYIRLLVYTCGWVYPVYTLHIRGSVVHTHLPTFAFGLLVLWLRIRLAFLWFHHLPSCYAGAHRTRSRALPSTGVLVAAHRSRVALRGVGFLRVATLPPTRFFLRWNILRLRLVCTTRYVAVTGLRFGFAAVPHARCARFFAVTCVARAHAVGLRLCLTVTLLVLVGSRAHAWFGFCRFAFARTALTGLYYTFRTYALPRYARFGCARVLPVHLVVLRFSAPFLRTRYGLRSFTTFRFARLRILLVIRCRARVCVTPRTRYVWLRLRTLRWRLRGCTHVRTFCCRVGCVYGYVRLPCGLAPTALVGRYRAVPRGCAHVRFAPVALLLHHGLLRSRSFWFYRYVVTFALVPFYAFAFAVTAFLLLPVTLPFARGSAVYRSVYTALFYPQLLFTYAHLPYAFAVCRCYALVYVLGSLTHARVHVRVYRHFAFAGFGLRVAWLRTRVCYTVYAHTLYAAVRFAFTVYGSRRVRVVLVTARSGLAFTFGLRTLHARSLVLNRLRLVPHTTVPVTAFTRVHAPRCWLPRITFGSTAARAFALRGWLRSCCTVCRARFSRTQLLPRLVARVTAGYVTHAFTRFYRLRAYALLITARLLRLFALLIRSTHTVALTRFIIHALIYHRQVPVVLRYVVTVQLLVNALLHNTVLTALLRFTSALRGYAVTTPVAPGWLPSCSLRLFGLRTLRTRCCVAALLYTRIDYVLRSAFVVYVRTRLLLIYWLHTVCVLFPFAARVTFTLRCYARC